MLEENIRELQNHEAILKKQLQSLEKKFQLKTNKTKGEIAEILKSTKECEYKLSQKEQVCYFQEVFFFNFVQKEIINLDQVVNDLKKIAKKSVLGQQDREVENLIS